MKSPKSVVIGMGFLEEDWRSSQIHAERLHAALRRIESPHAARFDYRLFSPSLGRKPSWTDRRWRYHGLIPKGELFHLVDPAYGDALLTAKRRFARSVVTITDLAFWRQRSLLNHLVRRRIVFGVNAADMRLAISGQVADDAARELGCERPRVVYLGTDPETFTYEGGARDPHLLIHVGTTVERKGVDRALRLLAALPEPFRLLQIGGVFTAGQRELIKELGLAARVEQKSNASLSELVSHYHAASALLFPSRYEGYGLPCIEARLCGTSVVTEKTLPVMEVLQNDPGTLALNFTAFDEAAHAEAARAEKSRFIGFQRVSRPLANRAFFSWDRTAREVLTVYESLIG